jgi:hypothetical protein
MPPWPPDQAYNSLAHERVLTEEEVEIIAAWVAAGTPEGTGSAPVAPVFTGNEEIIDPDAVLSIPQYTISSTGNDVFRCFVIPAPWQQDIYITELEVVPDNRSAVHHVMVYQDSTDLPQQLDDAESGPGYTSFGNTNSDASMPVAGWNPGQGKKVFPQGMGIKVRAGSDIIMQIHYPPTANGQSDQTRLNVKYTTEPLREIGIYAFLQHFWLNEGPLEVPANEVRTFTADHLLPINVDYTLLDVNVHMHLLGKSARVWAEMPNSDLIPLIRIPEWNFHWQGFYDFRQPVRIPGGTVFSCEVTYDNTTANLSNPNNPPQTVVAGNDSDEEMMLVFFSYLPYQPGDEDIVVDTTTAHGEHECAMVGTADQGEMEEFILFPDPVEDEVHFRSSTPIAALSVFDVMGRPVVIHQKMANSTLSVAQLPPGMYYMEAETEKGSLLIRRFIKR